VRSAFDFAAATAEQGQVPPELARLLADLDFRHVCIVADDGRIAWFMPIRSGREAPERIEPTALRLLQEATRNGEGVAFLPVRAGQAGEPEIVLARSLVDGRLAFAAIGTEFIRRVQANIAFGERGHAAIFDAAGNVLAHPIANWWQNRLNQAKLSVVQRMMAGETGVAFF
jgi:hypothetical protein